MIRVRAHHEQSEKEQSELYTARSMLLHGAEMTEQAIVRAVRDEVEILFHDRDHELHSAKVIESEAEKPFGAFAHIFSINLQ